MKISIRSICLLFFTLIISTISAQHQWQDKYGGRGGQSATGRFYGKVVDSKTGKGIAFVAVQLSQNRWDSVTKSMSPRVVAGQITQENGDFSLDNVPVKGKYILAISGLGYEKLEQEVSFESSTGGATVSDKDLGNIKLKILVQELKAVDVVGTESNYRLEIDKKVYNVEKDQISAGGTAEDALKKVPSLSVDMDGNVTVRNEAPQIFVDGRITTLTLDQIPADAIEKVEVITNPSAKYDASGGGAGIVNIVLKKNRKVGYNGNLRAGIDQRTKVYGGGDVNAREKKINIFLSGNLRQRSSVGEGITDRKNLLGDTLTNVFQNSVNTIDGHHLFVRSGLDFFMNNRNTLTLAGNMSRGQFDPEDRLSTNTDTLLPSGVVRGTSIRESVTHREFKNFGGSFMFKHIFPKAGHEFSSDFAYNRSRSESNGDFVTNYFDASSTGFGQAVKQQTTGEGKNEFMTGQVDYVNPVKNKIKIESGARAAVRNYQSVNENFIYNYSTNEFEKLNKLTSNYRFTDQVYAGYFTFSNRIGKLGYMAGLRGESSDYTGELIDSGYSFRNTYPISLFPSIFFSYEASDKNTWQFNVTRRINRPNFFQILPFTDYSDSLNLSRGNPGLKPEFTYSTELSYERKLGNGSNLIASTYFKNTQGLMSRYQFYEYSEVLGRDVVVSTYRNANASYSYGVELTMKNTLVKIIDITTNLNLYNAVIDGKNLDSALTNEQLSWTADINAGIKLPKNFSLQLTYEYESKRVMPSGVGGAQQGGHGGGYWGGGGQSTVQGYISPSWQVDASAKYEFLKNKAASVSISITDIFESHASETYSSSPFFTQNTWRIRDARFVRANFSYRFGKFDISLFKRKNNRDGSEGPMDVPMQ